MKVLIIGAGASGSIHAGILSKRGHEVAIYDVDPEKAEALAIVNEAVVADDTSGTYDVVVVCSPANTHRALVEESLDLGRKVVCEKPLALTTLDAHCLASRYDEGRLFIAESQAYSGEDGLDVLRMKERIVAGEFGDEVIWRVCAMTSYQPQSWCSDIAIGGGAFLEGGVHVLTVARVLFGRPKSWFGSVRNFAGGTAPDSGTLVIDYEKGHQLLLQIGWGTEGCFTGEVTPLPNSFGLFGAKSCEAWWPGDNHSAMWVHLEKCLLGQGVPVARVDDAAGAVGDVWNCFRSEGSHPLDLDE